MKCISIHPEYVMEILSGEKTKEYRNWTTKYRGKILIATTKTRVSNAYICAVADLVDCVEQKNKDIEYKYAFVLENIKEIAPLPVKGNQRIYNVDYEEDDLEIISGKSAKYINKVYDIADEWIIIKK